MRVETVLKIVPLLAHAKRSLPIKTMLYALLCPVVRIYWNCGELQKGGLLQLIIMRMNKAHYPNEYNKTVS